MNRSTDKQHTWLDLPQLAAKPKLQPCAQCLCGLQLAREEVPRKRIAFFRTSDSAQCYDKNGEMDCFELQVSVNSSQDHRARFEGAALTIEDASSLD